MRIKSNFKDYYDAAQALGYDDHVLFLRETTVVEHQRKQEFSVRLRPFVEMAHALVPADQYSSQTTRDYAAWETQAHLVVFAGRLYPLMAVTATHRSTYERKRTFTASKEEFVQALSEVSCLELKAEAARVEHFFSLAKSERLLNYAVEQRLPIVSYTRPGILHIVTVNPNLRHLEFFRHLSAYEAAQELEMFLGNLAAPERQTVVIEDKHRIPQHGFDKYSFRHRPSDD